MNLVIQLLSCELLGYDVHLAVGRYVAEQALFAAWFHGDAKASSVEALEMLHLLAFAQSQTARVFDAWSRFRAAKDADQGPPGLGPGAEIRSAYRGILAALHSAIESLNGVRTESRAVG
ncbi:hypothetical protein [Phytomonospora endophytica]|uniref:Uncharacterized protein n=1 Tax=Phytomonospora endophytica TaxID=714109 RepID=A0A841FVU1_9ACTN|nr:hypothetical protein [Phytomonospora endophytica]MBB6036599.1 hypothetical protein [Phytomonospora endophytica]